MQGNAENQQWMHKLHEKGRGRAAEQKHERAAASLAQAKSDLRATCAEVCTRLQFVTPQLHAWKPAALCDILLIQRLPRHTPVCAQNMVVDCACACRLTLSWNRYTKS